MDWKLFFTIFVSVFIAELGDKTQIATMMFSSNKDVSRLTVFMAAAAALVVSTAIGVFAGKYLSNFISEKQLHIVAGVVFILIGSWTLYKA